MRITITLSSAYKSKMLKKNLRYLLDIAFKTGLLSGDISEEPKYKLKFNPLWSLSETEQATVEQTRAATALTKAQTAQIYIDMQAMDPSEVREKLVSDDDFIVEEIVDNEADNDLLNSLYTEENGDFQSLMPLGARLPTIKKIFQKTACQTLRNLI